MAEITKPLFEDYMKALYEDNDPVRREMEALAEERNFPIVGPLVGRSLSQLAQMIGARRVFELGSGYGYSALFFARAVGQDGVVHCTDLSEENIRSAEKFLKQAGVWARVTYHQEEATAALRRVGGLWDVIYNDIDKESYPDTVDLAYRHLRRGGLFITDNLLWSGRVFRENEAAVEAPDNSTQAILDFTQHLFDHPGFLTTLYPVRDGVSVALRR